MVVGKVVNDGDCGRAIRGEEFLICLEKTLVDEKIGEIVVVKSVRGRRVKVVQCRSTPTLGTILLKSGQIG